MLYFPQSKINLGINIVSKRHDGYHNIETLFYPIALTDTLELSEASETSFATNGLSIEGNVEDNLVVRALRLMQKEYGVPNMKIHLEKRIPMGAGLGGGSSDAAATLVMLNQMFSLGCSDDTLCSLAVKLGADCPFFIHSRPMFASGIGELLTPAKVDLSDYHIVLIKPNIHVSTAEAYANCIPLPWQSSLKTIVEQPIDTWKNILFNDFEKSVFGIYPVLNEIKNTLYHLGATYASMSGSGSTIYALFSSMPDSAETDSAVRKCVGNIEFTSYYL